MINMSRARSAAWEAGKYKIKLFVIILTDKVVNPVNVIGMSKLMVEMEL